MKKMVNEKKKEREQKEQMKRQEEQSQYNDHIELLRKTYEPILLKTIEEEVMKGNDKIKITVPIIDFMLPYAGLPRNHCDNLLDHLSREGGPLCGATLSTSPLSSDNSLEIYVCFV
jgi:hypothetical protein